ncbi:MAG: hypothetical protein ABI550_03170, partial [Ignavibacteriaceae bacterium]
GNITSASSIFSSKASRIFGMNAEYFRSIYDYYTHVRNKPHLIDRYLDVVKLCFKEINVKNLYEFDCNFNGLGKILIHPFAGWEAKEWGLQKFIELSVLLNQSYDVEMILENKKLSFD